MAGLRDGLFGGPGAAIDGLLHPDFMGVAQTFTRLLRQYQGGAAVCIYHRGVCVADLWGGVRNRDGDPWQHDTLALSFSTTKGVASTLIHIMVDRGLLDYDARVADYWPEFGQAGKAEITLRQVLAHQSGLYHIRQMVDHADRMIDWEYMVRAIERTTPIHPPGERTGYHGLTYGYLVGEILQRVTGRSFRELVHEELVTPLDLDGMYVGASNAALSRAADLIWPAEGLLEGSPLLAAQLRRIAELGHAASQSLGGALRLAGLRVDLGSIFDALAPRGISSFDFGSRATLRAAIPAANGLFTARSLARMYAALAGGGQLGDTRLLSSATLARATERQKPTKGLAVIPFDMRWRLGYHGIATTAGFPENAFGHFGFGGSGGWADPDRELAVALIVNRGMGTPFGDTRTARISGAAIRCVDARKARTRSQQPAGAPQRAEAPAV